MRLIDADATIKEIKARNPDDVSYEDAWAITCIEHAPTIEPERTGKWIKEKSRGQLYQCSACGNYLDFRGVNAGRGSANYCPNCGARMEETSCESMNQFKI